MVILMLFYDGPQPLAGVFQKFQEIPALDGMPNSLKTQAFHDFVNSIPATNALQGQRVAFHSLSVPTISPEVVQELQNIIFVCTLQI
jgi:hypothetical protein